MASTLAGILLGFLAGSVPTAYIFVKIRTGQDIRTLGSGNVGATNVFRVLGFRAGAWVLALDALKGFVPAWAGYHGGQPGETALLLGLLTGISAILGHVFSPFLSFRGGKGVATGLGVALALFPPEALTACILWGITLKITRYMSCASLAGIWAFSLIVLCRPYEIWVKAVILALAIFVTWTHRANIQRLFRGEEKPLVINKINS